MSKSNKKTKKLVIKIFLIIFSISLALGLAGFGILHSMLSKVENVELNKEELGIASKDELDEFKDHEKIKNIALFGIDSADGVGRSDTMIIATIDPIHDKLKISSLMRDSYVNIKNHGTDKLNHAYAFGGPQLAINTINQNFGLNVEDFVTVDFASLPKIIDILGGIELNITSA